MTTMFAVNIAFPVLAQSIPLPVQQINVVCLKLLQAFSDRLPNVFCIVADFATSFRCHMIPEFGGQEDLHKP